MPLPSAADQRDVYIVEALRTPLFAEPDDRTLTVSVLASRVLTGVVARSGVDPARVGLAVVQGLPAGPTLASVGLDHVIPALQLLPDGCGLAALYQGVLAVGAGAGGGARPDVVLVGAAGHDDPPGGDEAMVRRLMDRAGVSEEDVDRWLELSAGRAQQAAQRQAWRSETVDILGRFDDVSPVPSPVSVSSHPVVVRSRSRSRPGAAAVLLASGLAVRELGLRPRARVVGSALVAVDPGLGPRAVVPAAQAALQSAGIPLQSLDRVELDERWPAASLAAAAELGLDLDCMCVDGAAAITGRLAGAGGLARLVTLVAGLASSGGRFGLCAGAAGAQAVAVLLDCLPYD